MNWTALNVIEHRGTFLVRSDGEIILLQQFNTEFSLRHSAGSALASCCAYMVAYWLNEAQAEPTGIAVDILRPVVDQFEEIRKGQSDDTKRTTRKETR